MRQVPPSSRGASCAWPPGTSPGGTRTPPCSASGARAPTTATTAPCASLALCEAQRKTDYDLARHQHGKTRVRVLKVRREGGVHAISEYKVETTLFSPAYDRVFTKGDNTDLVATDTQKNTVYIVAKRTDASTPEAGTPRLRSGCHPS